MEKIYVVNTKEENIDGYCMIDRAMFSTREKAERFADELILQNEGYDLVVTINEYVLDSGNLI